MIFISRWQKRLAFRLMNKLPIAGVASEWAVVLGFQIIGDAFENLSVLNVGVANEWRAQFLARVDR